MVVEPLFAYLIEAFPPGHAYGRQAVSRSPMPPLVARFLTQQLESQLNVEAKNLRAGRSRWFDYDAPDVQEAYQAFLGALARHAQIPSESWQEALRQAIVQVIAYLVNPTRTLVDFVFQHGEETLPAHVVSQRIGHFGAYAYLRDAVETYLEQKALPEIDRHRFSKLLLHVDRQMTEDYAPDDWARLLKPLFDLADAAPHQPAGVPNAMLQDFFEGKEAHGIVQRLQAEQEQRGAHTLDAAGLLRLLGTSNREPRNMPTSAPPSPQPRPQATSPVPPAEEDGPLPLWKRFQQGPRNTSGPAASPLSPPPSPAPAPKSMPQVNENVPLWQRFRPTSDPADTHGAASPAPDELHALERDVLGGRGTRNRDLFIKHLFGGSPSDYERTLRRIQTAASWTQASGIIAEEVFKKHQVNIYSEPAVLFTDAVEAQFKI